MREKLFNDFESRKLELAERLDLKKQYKSQVKALQEIGIPLTVLSDEYFGIVGEDGKEYPLPTCEEILERITEEKLELLERKVNEGFNQLLLVPFALPTKLLIESYKELLLKKDSEDKLYSTDGERLKLNRREPISFQEGYFNREMVYYPKSFDKKNHQGKTKKELIKKEGGWQILLLEDLPDLPGQGEGEEINKKRGIRSERIPPEANKSPNQYLEMLKNDSNYKGEEGLTLEAWFIYAMTYLQKNNQQIDHWQGKGKACFLLGSYFPAISRVVPFAYWLRNRGQVSLYRHEINRWSAISALRSVVKI